MSDDGFSDCFDEPNMEIQIKTLLGTSFDMKVSSTETIGDIKKKIYRVEGIPIYQQNLIFRSKELKDSKRLCDAGIRDGSTITLVASMRGGPISTRRLSVACEHHVMLKELKELLENTRDEIGEKLAPGSKVSVLVFKEGDIINLLRVIENEDGSYSPYSEKPISPPAKPPRKESQMGIFERLVEDNEMSTKIANLRKKMEDVSIRRQVRTHKPPSDNNTKIPSDIEDKLFGEAAASLSALPYKFLAECDLFNDVDLRIFERSFEEENQSETEEIALKDKHRTKPNRLSKSTKSLYSESKGATSHTKQNYARMHKKTRDLRACESSSSSREIKKTTEDFLNSSILAPLRGSTSERKEMSPTLAEKIAVLEENDYSESLSVSARNRVHLTRLVLSEGSERPKSSPDSIELEENAQDLWEIHEPASERLKHSATCNVGLLKRRQSLDYGYEGIENTPNVKPEIGAADYNYCKNSEFEVCSSNFYHMPQFVSSPSAIPPQYAPKDQGLCDYYFRNNSRSPLYGRKSKTETTDLNYSTKPDEYNNKSVPKLPEIKNDKYSFLSDCSSIQRLKNDCVEPNNNNKSLSDSLFSSSGQDDSNIDDLYGYYNLGCSTELLLGEKSPVLPRIEKKDIELRPVIKKKARCNECNKRLNITNIYNCRCGKIFCSQHRYSEVHRCSYDYKSEGRRILEQQNPLVTAEKVNRI